MAESKLTLIGLYNYDDTLFDSLSLPSGIDKTLAINCILHDGGEFEVVYSDIEFLKSMIGVVSSKWNRTFSKWYEALQLEYNPIYNFDRFEEWTDSGTDTGTVKTDTTGTESGKDSTTTTSSETSSSNGQTDTLVNAYNNNTLVQDGRSTSTQSATSSGNGSTSGTDSRDTSSNGTETRNLATSGKHDGHLYGNVGVTTSQQMLESELELAEWNLYQHISNVFVRELCIMVY